MPLVLQQRAVPLERGGLDAFGGLAVWKGRLPTVRLGGRTAAGTVAGQGAAKEKEASRAAHQVVLPLRSSSFPAFEQSGFLCLPMFAACRRDFPSHHRRPASMAEAAPSDEEDRLRFQAELEFVQALANPEYLHHLAQHRFFDDPAFRAYISYLSYWREAPYCLHIAFPHCLHMLELLQTSEQFVAQLKHAQFKDHIHLQQHTHWRWRAVQDVASENASTSAKDEASSAPELQE